MVEIILPLAAAAAPSISLLYIFYLQDRFPEPISMIIKVFLLGIIIAIPAYFLNNLSINVLSNFYEDNLISIEKHIFLNSLIPGALVEETLKILVLYFFCFRSKHLDEKMDALVYGATVSLGFACVENIHYVSNASYYELSWSVLAWLRAFTAVPAHALWGIIMGYYLYSNKSNISQGFTMGLGIPVILHMLYNSNYASYAVMLIISLFIAVVLLREVKEDQRRIDTVSV